jgi:hypothetical protein
MVRSEESSISESIVEAQVRMLASTPDRLVIARELIASKIHNYSCLARVVQHPHSRIHQNSFLPFGIRTRPRSGPNDRIEQEES